MRIGIDIDNTLTDVQNELNNAAYEYTLKLGKNLDENINLGEAINNNGNFYREKFKLSYDELKYFLGSIHEEIVNKAKPRKSVVESIKKLKDDGHLIYIVTARDSEFHENPYLLSKNWLDKNNIEYDKLIVNARKKAPVCKEENIDIFIDDQLHNCEEIVQEGIKVIRITNDVNNYKDIVNLSDWDKIYEYISKMEK